MPTRSEAGSGDSVRPPLWASATAGGPCDRDFLQVQEREAKWKMGTTWDQSGPKQKEDAMDWRRSHKAGCRQMSMMMWGGPHSMGD
jgi:hypothetical protein